ncbi:MAG: hypothetical protein GC193_07290 [Cryomorphaceae bacterium]|nr:hypothetical protein [Cryomorphaceae bacterium]
MSFLSELKNILILIPLIYWLRMPSKWVGWIGYLGVYLILGFGVELIGFITRKMGLDNHTVYQIYAAAAFVVVHVLLFLLHQGKKMKVTKSKIALKASGLVLCLIICVLVSKFNTLHLILFSAFTFAIHCLIVLYGLSSNSERPLLRSGEFWTGMGILFLSTCDIPALGLGVHLAKTDKILASKVLSIHDVGFIVQLVVFTVSLHFANTSNELNRR